MLMSEGWVNGASIAIVAIAVVRLCQVARARRARVAETSTAAKDPVSSVDAYLLQAHTHGNRAEIARSEMCGCVSCGQLYRPTEIAGWAGETAVCPRCGRKTVVGSGAGIVLTRELLHRSRALGVSEETPAG
jgi:uncharacterized paraquat-inducible protein A